jgi:hypothetical protein
MERRVADDHADAAREVHVAVGTGGFQGQWGVGVTATYRLPLATPAYVGASYGNGGGNENVWRVMGAVEF